MCVHVCVCTAYRILLEKFEWELGLVRKKELKKNK